MLTELSFEALLDREFVGRHRAEHVQIAEVPCVQYLIGWIVKTFDYINHVTKRFRFRSTRVHGHTLPLSLLCIS